MAANIPSRPATAANEPTVLAEAQPACWAETTVYTSRSIAAVTVTAPGMSNLTATEDSVVTAWREIAAACAALERELGDKHGLGRQ